VPRGEAGYDHGAATPAVYAYIVGANVGYM
jgi:hypothetical protein